MQKLIDAGITTPEAAAALTRSELLARPGIGPATVGKVETWLASHGLELRAEKPKRVKPSAKPWTDLWTAIWLERRGTPYQWPKGKEFHRAAAHCLGLADACGMDADVFRRCCENFQRWIDQDDWKASPATVDRARYQAAALLQERHVPKRGRFEMSDEARKENDRRGREIMERRAEMALARGKV